MGRPVNCASGHDAFLDHVTRAARAVGRDGQVVAAFRPGGHFAATPARRAGCDEPRTGCTPNRSRTAREQRAVLARADQRRHARLRLMVPRHVTPSITISDSASRLCQMQKSPAPRNPSRKNTRTDRRHRYRSGRRHGAQSQRKSAQAPSR